MCVPRLFWFNERGLENPRPLMLPSMYIVHAISPIHVNNGWFQLLQLLCRSCFAVTLFMSQDQVFAILVLHWGRR